MSASKTASIDQLSSQITKHNGFARSNLFSVILPRFEQSGQDPRDLNLLCKNVQLPSFNLATIPREIGMSTTEVAHGMTYQPIQMTFRVMNDQGVRKYFETWMNSIIPNWQSSDPTDHYVGYYDDYVGTMQIFQLDKNDRRRHGVELVECYPSNVGELQADYGVLNSIYLMPVTWSYRYWKNLT